MGSTNVRHEAWKWQAWRECGQKFHTGWRDRLHSVLYSSVKTFRSWDVTRSVGTSCPYSPGGIFNFDFSHDGSILVAACERKSVLLFDPLNAKLIGHKENAHNDCVNCVRFLDNRTFVTCSDDTTVSLWDVRNLKQQFRVLRGHSNWVKNIEYDNRNGLLVTSGFDGSIYTWDINTYSESDRPFQRVFYTNGLMRTRLSPDNSKLIAATAGGYLMVIHNLNLATLSHDLMGFKPNMYRLMQMSRSPIRQGYRYNHVFTRKRNRVELISDFPEENEAEMIASLQVHPQGWCVLSRNTNNDENTEWTCVHDIQASKDEDITNLSVADSASSSRADSPNPRENTDIASHSHAISPAALPVSEPSSRSSSPTFMLSINMADSGASSPNLSPSGSGSQLAASANSSNSVETLTLPAQGQGEGQSEEHSDSEPDTHDVPQSSSGGENANLQFNTSRTVTLSDVERDSMTFIIRSGPRVSEKTLLLLGPGHTQSEQIFQNKPRLTHYIEEPNVGRGFIKEVSFSNDGRVVASPYAFGVRLLAFNPNCSELCDALSGSPVPLHEVACNMSHKNVVVATKFSPTHCLLVSGCLSGKVDFHQPRL